MFRVSSLSLWCDRRQSVSKFVQFSESGPLLLWKGLLVNMEGFEVSDKYCGPEKWFTVGPKLDHTQNQKTIRKSSLISHFCLKVCVSVEGPNQRVME